MAAAVDLLQGHNSSTSGAYDSTCSSTTQCGNQKLGNRAYALHD
jgi:hypothetical protein